MLHGAAALSLGLLLPSALTAVSVAGLAAAVPVALGRAGDGTRAQGWVAAGAAALLAVFLAGGMLTSQGAAAGGTAQLTSANMAYDTTALTVPADEAAVAMTNSDLFWHTFTVDELGIDLWVPVRGERTIAIDAPPGTYEFYCRIPGHETIGMRGTLTVEG
jgi:plastocyanin